MVYIRSQKEGAMRRYLSTFVLSLIFCQTVYAQTISTAFEPKGPEVLMNALEPALRKWYVPQELYYEFGWLQWQYTNYARELYRRYTDIGLEGYKYYDIYGNYITRGWKIYEWVQDMPKDFGSTIFKSPKFQSWFDNLLISSTRKGQYYTALTVGDQIRTVFTPLTFSKPTFNGLQLDFLSDKYALTVLASRANYPGVKLDRDDSPPSAFTDFTNFVGLRGTIQLGRFVEVGATYVNAHLVNSTIDWADYSLKGRLTTAQNSTRVRTIMIRLSDDSPEDGEGGAMLFAEQIFIDGRPADIRPEIRGGIMREGRYEANGNMQMILVYDLTKWFYVDEKGQPVDASKFKKVAFELVLANDFKVEITSNAQVNELGQPIFLTVVRAPGNIKDATNQQVVYFEYGLPTANEIYGVTFELRDLAGFSLRAEYDVNNRYRRFPNPNPEIREHSVSSDKSEAWYVTLQKLAYPWYMYAEAFNLDPDYSTMMYICREAGRIDYENKYENWFEFVDDNDDQDRWPDWNRSNINQRAGNEEERGVEVIGGGVFPGLDENNDLVPDFNQNMNYLPDYEEPFLRYKVDPPEYLFGMDMNNNTVVDRFENDEEPDYPYKRDHRGYNVYVGAEMVRGVKLTLGHLHEWTISQNKRSKSNYILLTAEKSFPGVGELRVFESYKRVRDNIRDDLVQWSQLPGTKAAMVSFSDPLACRNTEVNTFYADFHYTGLEKFNFVTKLKYEIYRQLSHQPGLRDYSDLLGIIGKADYTLSVKGISLQPRIKTMLLRRKSFEKGEPDRGEFWVFPSVVGRIPVFEGGTLEVGLEYTDFSDLADRPDVEDFRGLVFAVQLSTTSSYMGYLLTSNVGYRQDTRHFEGGSVKVSNTIFVQIFAGVE